MAYCPACGKEADREHKKLLNELNRYMKKDLRDYKRSKGIVKKAEWLTARDERVCDFCKKLEGKRFPLDDLTLEDYVNGNHNLCNNKHCRCTLIPYMGDE